MQRLGRGAAIRQRPGGAGNGAGLCPRTRAVGAARLPRGAPSHSLCPVALSRVPRRIGFGAAPGRGFAASEPSTQRFRRARSKSPIVRYGPHVPWSVFFIPIVSGSGSFALRAKFPSLAWLPDRKPPPGSGTGVFGGRPSHSRLSGPGIGAERRGHRRGSGAGPFAVFGFELDDWHHAALDCRRQRSPG